MPNGGAKLIQCLDKWMEWENVTCLDQMKNVVGLEQFYSILPGELHYLVKDKNSKNLLQASDSVTSVVSLAILNQIVWGGEMEKMIVRPKMFTV